MSGLVRFVPAMDWPPQDHTGNETLTQGHVEVLHTNTGATSKPILTLPAAQKGLMLPFLVTDTDGLRILAAGNDTIRLGGIIGKVAGYIESLEVGSFVFLEAVSDTEWLAISLGGLWLVERASDVIYVPGAGWAQQQLSSGLGATTNGIVAGGATRYISVNGGGCHTNASEAPSELKAHRAGKVISARVYLSAVATVGDPVITLRKNGAGAGITVTVPAGSAAGWYELAGTAFDLAEGDRLTLECVNGATGNTTFTQIQVLVIWR